MKIFHTSDWHFGRTLLGADLTPAFEQWADFLVQTVREQSIDAVLISGDVYDRGVPPVAMVDLLSDTLLRLSETTHVVLTSGNHDSAKRLGFGSTLMRPELRICTDSRKSASPVLLPDNNGNLGAIVYPIPYLDPDVERTQLAPDQAVLARSHDAVIREAMRRIRDDILHGEYCISSQAAPLGSVPRIVMAHAFVTGGASSESEQDIHIGGTDSVPSSIFDIRVNNIDSAMAKGTDSALLSSNSDTKHEGEKHTTNAHHALDDNKPLIDYAALGHLHGAQQVNRDGQPLMRYSGSPVPFSFSEEKHIKSGVLLEFCSGDSSPHTELIEAPVYRRLATLQATFEELCSDTYARYRDMFVRAHVTDPARPRDLAARLRNVFPYLLETKHITPSTVSTAQKIKELKTNPLGTLHEFFTENGGRSLTAEEESLIEALWNNASQLHEEQEK